MADNYLERKMEDFRKSASFPHHYNSSPKRKGFYFPCPSKRVLIITRDNQREDFARAFLKAECKIAMIHDNKETGEKMASLEGIRFYPLALSDKYEVEKAFRNVLDVWRDIDIIICDSSIVPTIVPIWKKHRALFPYVSDYICRLLIMDNVLPPRMESDSLLEIQEQIKELKVSANSIKRISTQTDITDFILSLSLPKNGIITGMRFEV